MDKNGLKLVGGTNLTELEKTQIELESYRSLIERAGIKGYADLEEENKKLNKLPSKIEALKTENKGLKEQIQILTNTRQETIDKAIEESNKAWEAKLVLHERQAEYDKEQSLKDQRYNIESKKLKPAREAKEHAEEERDRIQGMYNKLLEEHNVTHKKLDTITEKLDNQNKQMEALKSIIEQITGVKGDTEDIIEILNNDIKDGIASLREAVINNLDTLLNEINKCNTKEELESTVIDNIEDIKDNISSKRKPTEEEKRSLCEEIKKHLDSGMTNKEIAKLLISSGNIWFKDMKNSNAAEQKVGRYIKMFTRYNIK